MRKILCAPTAHHERYTECLKKKFTLLNNFAKLKIYNIFGKYPHVWMAEGLIYHMTPQNLKISSAWVSTAHFCKGYGNQVAQELDAHFG